MIIDLHFFLYYIPVLLHRLLPKWIIIKIPKGPLKGYNWLLGSGSFKMILGTHEKEFVHILMKILYKNQVFYDVGAHVGYYSLLSSKIVGESGKVVAFEPSPNNLLLLLKNLKLNNISNVQVINACVGDKEGIVMFDLNDDSSTSHIDTSESLKVKMVTIDNLTKKCIIPLPNMLKIDVEGAELLVLKGMTNTLKLYHPLILLSTHSQILHTTSVNLLEKHGYKLVFLDKREILAIPA